MNGLPPPYIINCLGTFDLDPCSPCEEVRPWKTALKHYSLPQDGLNLEWSGRVWCNPPYGKKTFHWLEKCYKHGNAVALVFARTETIGFHEQVWQRADGVFFFKGRLSFFHVDGTKGGTSNAPSCLVAYGWDNVLKIEQAARLGRIKGKLIKLDSPRMF